STSRPVIRKPEMTKNTTTPKCASHGTCCRSAAPSGKSGALARWPSSTQRMETARSPSSDGIRCVERARCLCEEGSSAGEGAGRVARSNCCGDTELRGGGRRGRASSDDRARRTTHRDSNASCDRGGGVDSALLDPSDPCPFPPAPAPPLPPSP